jgi:cobalamin-dependent methionine synthase I
MSVMSAKINGARKPVSLVLPTRDADFVPQLAGRQLPCGASYLDVNAGTIPPEKQRDMVWFLETVQAGTPDATLRLDSASPGALKATLEKTINKPMIRSLNWERECIEDLLPLASEFQTELIVFPLNDDGFPGQAKGGSISCGIS